MFRKVFSCFKIIIFFVLILFNKSSSGQCITTNPTCLLTNQTISFSSTISTITDWRIIDDLGNEIYPPNSTASYNFTNTGSYLIEGLISLGSNNWYAACTQFIIVGENMPTINTSNSSITICSGDAVYLALEAGISITDIIGPATYTWMTSNGDSYNGLSIPIVLTTETSVTLTVTDVTGCIVTQTININYSIPASGTSLYSMPSILCAGDPITFTANSPNPNYDYIWYINGEFFSGSSITTNINITIPNLSQNIEIILYIDNNSGGCPEYDIQTLIIPPTQFIVLDTSVTSWNTSYNAFAGCETMPYDITLYNLFAGNNSGISSLTITWVSDPSSGLADITTTQTSNFDSIIGTINETTSYVLITTNTSSGCSNTVSYNLLYNDGSGGNTTNSFGKICASECINSSIPFTIDPNQIYLPLNAQLRFIIECNNFFAADTIVWTYNDFVNSQDSIDISSCNQSENTQWRAIFRYNFPYSSCECDFTDAPGNFKIRSEIITSCNTSSNGILFALIEPSPSTQFLIPSEMCEESSISITNNSYFGCDPLASGSFDPSDSVYFSYSFGDSCNTIIIDTVSSYNDFVPITHNYNAGTYTITLNTSNKCSDSTVIETINVYPKPNLSFSALPVCYGFPTAFNSLASNSPATIDTVICFTNDTIFIPVPSGGNTFTYLWIGLDDNGETTTTDDDGEFILGDSTSANPQFIFYNCGAHPVSLIVTDEHGCDSMFLDTIVVWDTPKAGYLLSTVCEGVATTFTDTSIYNPNCFGAPIDQWAWNFGDGQNSVINFPQPVTFDHLYTPPCNPNDIDTTYITSLIVTDINGCTSLEEFDTARVYCEPNAEFDSSGICFDAPDFSEITLQNLSTPINGMNWLWNFPDATSSSLTNPSFTFTTLGDHLIQLILIGNNCNDTIDHLITVWENPDISIASSIDIACYGDSTGSINTSTNSGSNPYNWSWSTGQITPNIMGLDTGNYIVTVTDNNQCTNTDSIIINQQPLFEATFSATITTCYQGDDGTATAIPSGGTPAYTYLWNDASGQTNQTATGLSPGTYTCIITDQYLCDTVIDVNIQDPPQITNTIYEFICNGDSISINGLYYYTLGIYTQTLINSFGCDSILLIDIDTLTGPISGINSTASFSNCVPFEINSTILSASNLPTFNDSYYWYIDSAGVILTNTSNTIIPPTYTMYDDDYSVTIYLVTNNNNNCAPDTANITFTTTPNPIAIFTLDTLQGCSPLTVYTDTSGTTQGVNYTWTLVDDNFNIIQSYNLHQDDIIIYNSSNTLDSNFYIILTAGDPNSGCGHSDTSDLITVFPLPIANITISDSIICSDITVNVSDIGSSYTNNTTYAWTILPNANIITPNNSSSSISFTYNNSGISDLYNLELTLTTTDGCKDSVEQSIEVTTQPIPIFSITDTSCGGTLTTTNTSLYGNSWLWDVTPLSGVIISNISDVQPDITFPENNTNIPITYTVELTAYTSNGCDSSTTQTVIIYPLPEVEFLSSSIDGCDSLNVIFTNISDPLNGENIASMTFNWTVDGNSFSLNQDTSFVFINTGAIDSIYTIVLYGITSHGCLDTFSTLITIHPDPIAEIVTPGNMIDCAPLIINNILLYAIDYPNANDTYSWTLTHTDGTNVTGSGIDPPQDLITNDNDTVFVELIVTNNYGCTADTLNTIIITIEDPIASFTLDILQGCSPLTVYTDTSGTTQGVNYTWTLVDDNFNIIQSYNLHQDDIIIYNSSNTLDSNFYIILTAGDPNSGCGHSDTSDLITVFPLPIANITLSNVCDSIEALFIDNSDSTNVSIISWEWDFGDLLALNDTSIVQNPLPYIYTTWGQWDITLTITDQNECEDIDTKTITVWPNPNADFDTSYSCFPDAICANEITSLIDNSSMVDPLGGNLNTAYWHIDNSISPDFISSPASTPFPNQYTAGIHTIKHIIESEFGCKDSINSTLQVVDIPVPNFIINDSICHNESTIFVISNNSSGYILNYEWEITDSLGVSIWDSILNSDNLPIFPTLDQGIGPVKYYIYLTVSNCCGDSTFLDSLIILPTPQLFFNSIYCNSAIDLPIGTSITLEYGNIGFVNPSNTDTLIINWGDTSPNDTVLPDCGNIPGFPNNAVCWEELSHIYTSTGNYTICMTGINECDDSTYCCDINVTLNNISSFFQIYTNNICNGDTTEFIELSSNSYPNAIVDWWFDYNGNGIPQSNSDSSKQYIQNEIIQHVYPNPGIYLVYHRITSPAPNIYTDANISDSIFVYPKPDINFSFNNVCIYDAITFSNNSTIDNTLAGMPSQNINVIKWYIDDVLISSSLNLTHTFNSAGAKEIKLECWSNFNCYNVDSIIIDVYDQPVPNLTTTYHCEGIETFLDATSSSGSILYNSVIDEFCWDYNGIPSVDSCNFSGQLGYTFPTGNNNISIIIKDNNNCSDTLDRTIFITPNITTDFTFNDSICAGDSVIFINLSSNQADSYLWDFGFIGNNSTSQVQNPIIAFPAGGQTFVITLTTYNYVTSTNETCEAIDMDSIYIVDKPIADFTTTPVCANQTTLINNLSTNTAGNIIENKWEFSDSFMYEYNDDSIVPHNFYVDQFLGEIAWAKLIIRDINGCKDSILDSVYIYPVPKIKFSVPEFCEGDILIATDNSEMVFGNAFPNQTLTTGSWIFNNDLNNISYMLPVWNTLTPIQGYGSYIISLTRNTSENCSNTKDTLLSILERPKISSFNSNNFIPNQCGDSIILYLNGVFEADIWQYVFDNSHPYCWENIMANSTNINYLLCQPHNYQLNINLENYNGCLDTVSYNIHTYPKPEANFSFSPNFGCEDLEVTFDDLSIINNDATYHSFPQNSPSYITSYNWDFGDASPIVYSTTNSSITHSYSTLNGEKINFTPNLTVKTNHTCSNTEYNDSITISPTPQAQLFEAYEEFGIYQFNGSNSTISINSSVYTTTENYEFSWLFYNANNTDTISSQHYPFGQNQNMSIIDYTHESSVSNQSGYSYDAQLIVKLKDMPNCADTISINYNVNFWKGLFVPNALTADINNEEVSLFWPKGKSLKEYNLEVFDIWGNLIWESKDLNAAGSPTKESAWDGTINGVPVPQGTYIWKIYGIFSDGEIWLDKDKRNTGPIYLIR
mgnify:CR=1 FL=1